MARKRQQTGDEPPPQTDLPLLDTEQSDTPPTPDFGGFLSKPVVKLPLPGDFLVEQEEDHLRSLWADSSALRQYSFQAFVHAGGSGLVFRASRPGVNDGQPVALKIVRAKLYRGRHTNPNIATSLSPVSPHELRALTGLAHPNIVQLYEGLANERGVFALATTYVEDPQPLDEFLRLTLQKHPDRKKSKGLAAFSPQRLELACAFLLDRYIEVAEALVHMHGRKFFHCDVKPANLLVARSQQVILTDLGASVHEDDSDVDGKLRIQFTWTYAHPQLTDLVSDPKGVSGGGLKASAAVPERVGLARFDLFALARTMQETLAALVDEFGERCYAAYTFRCLHLISALLLDGRVAPIAARLYTKDKRRFVSDAALDYPPELFAIKKLETASALLERLIRCRGGGLASLAIPELDRWGADVINTGAGLTAPFTSRVKAVLNHPCLRRLRGEPQLGWVREVYPGATHTRWSHTLGVLSATADFYAALLSDHEVPTALLLLTPSDVEHALVAAMLHDVGQTSFGHDFEGAAPELYHHENLIFRLLKETKWGAPTLEAVITQEWKNVSLPRVLAILGYKGADGNSPKVMDPVDGLARDIINGPIDADKLDYLVRDGMACGVPYGAGIDRDRFLRALSVDVKAISRFPRLALAYRVKGAAAVESVLLARYQLYGAIYWHHTFRCIQAMFAHSVASSLAVLADDRTIVEIPGVDVSNRVEVDKGLLRDFFYYRVICGCTLDECKSLLKGLGLPASFFAEGPTLLSMERALEFAWKCGDGRARELIERLATRKLFRRVFELRTGDLGEHGDYTKLAAALDARKREGLSKTLEKLLSDAVYKRMQEKGPVESVSENEARKRHGDLLKADRVLIVVDYPTRGIPEERNFPRPISDPARKYIAGRGGEAGHTRSVFHTVRRLQVAIAPLRVLAAPDFHELIIRYLDPSDIQNCVESALPELDVAQ
ncbi:MAG: protein kinase [Thermoanaerobaculia bacterium]